MQRPYSVAQYLARSCTTGDACVDDIGCDTGADDTGVESLLAPALFEAAVISGLLGGAFWAA